MKPSSAASPISAIAAPTPTIDPGDRRRQVRPRIIPIATTNADSVASRSIPAVSQPAAGRASGSVRRRGRGIARSEFDGRPEKPRRSTSSASPRRRSWRRPRSRAAPTSSSSGSRSRTRSRRGRRSGSRPSGRSRAGCGRRECLECIADVRARVDVPLVPMTYAAILEAYGYERFVADSRAAGRDQRDRRRPAGRGAPRGAARSSSSRRPRPTSGSRCAPAAPTAGSTSSRSRARRARATRSPPRSPGSSSGRARRRTCRSTPGFGISTPAHAAAVAALADGVVVGSRAVQVAEEGPAALRDYVRTLRDAIDAVAG